MIFKEKKEKYIFIFAIAIILVVSGPLQFSSPSYAFYDRYIFEQTTTTHRLYEERNNFNMRSQNSLTN
jgi:hypothetical protein